MESKTIVAVDIGGTKIACGLVTLGGDAPVIEAVEKVPTDAMKGGAHVLATVIEQVKPLLLAQRLSRWAWYLFSRRGEPPHGRHHLRQRAHARLGRYGACD